MFANHVAYLICREIDLHDNLKSLSLENVIKDGILHKTVLANGEEVIPIVIRFRDYEEIIQWDITNPDNSPEKFAVQTCKDLGLDQ